MTNYSHHKTRKVKIHGVQVLTVTSKMAGPSFSLPAGKACPNRFGDICGNCYADKGCYQYRTTRNAQQVRFRWTVDAMKTAEGKAQWIDTIVTAIRTSEAKYFRIHDSGDFFNVAYVEAWIAVVKALPRVRFWVPTREYQIKATVSNPFTMLDVNPRMDALRRLASLPNIAVRPSALNIGDSAPNVAGLHAGSAVSNPDAFQCGAYRRNGECGNCRTCWNAPSVAVSYPLH